MRVLTAIATITCAALLGGCVPSEPQINDMLTLKDTLARVTTYFNEHGEYPRSLDDLPYDSWDHPIQYTSSGTTFELRALGEDGIEQTCTSRNICGNLELDTIVTNEGWICLCTK